MTSVLATALPELPVLADEVVTSAHVRYVELPLGAGRAALITIDNGKDHTRPTTLGPTGLRNIDEALAEVAARPGLAAVAVTGKPFVFAVGADLGMIRGGGSHDDALAIARAGHHVFARLRDSAVPTFALLNGPVLGGGLELALHCHYRTMSGAVSAVAFPECFLGLVPGWGGTQLLPHLIGPDAAVTVIIENPLNNNRTMTGPAAAALGIADVLLEPADFLAQSLHWVAQVVRGELTVPRRPADDEATWQRALARGRAVADARTRGHATAPYRALDLLALARTATFAEGTAAEDTALADAAAGDELRASLYAFDLVQKRARRPAGAPDASLARPVTKVGVVGAGLMAGQLALLFARRLGVPVVMTDLDQGRVDAGVARVHADIDALLAKRTISPDAGHRVRALVTGSTSMDAYADADWVIEAVFEDPQVKATVLAQLESVVTPVCVLATNTSSLSVTDMAAGLRHPERVVGFHFFNPVAVLPLLEVVRAGRTDDATLATAFTVGKALKKSCVAVADAPAFVFNRLLTRALGEVIAAVDAGMDPADADAAVSPLGMPLPPFALVELVGPAIALHTAESLHTAFPERFAVSPGFAAVVAAGKRAVYLPTSTTADPEVLAVWRAAVAPSGTAPTGEELLERTRAALADEVRWMLDDGVAAAPDDIDLCMILGGGFPFWNGGLTPYLDRTGTAERVTGRRFLAPGVASLPSGVSGLRERDVTP